MINTTYTGVGSREVPFDTYQLIVRIATELNELGYTLRSGGANGCDSAFEAGGLSNSEIFIPWVGFNHRSGTQYIVPNLKREEAVKITIEVIGKSHWNNLSEGAKKLHTRNAYQVLGKDLNSPSRFLVCYTKEGKTVGGTATAIKLAEKFKVPVYNLGTEDGIIKFLDAIEQYTIIQ